MTTRTILSLALAAGLGACAAPGAVGPTVSRPVVPYTSAGLERVIGQDAAGLVRLFGQPDADIREGAARKLQFAGPICVLDAYLYPNMSCTASSTMRCLNRLPVETALHRHLRRAARPSAPPRLPRPASPAPSVR
jgi:hypothetical protein